MRCRHFLDNVAIFCYLLMPSPPPFSHTFLSPSALPECWQPHAIAVNVLELPVIDRLHRAEDSSRTALSLLR